jgi:ribosomal protein L29
MKTFEQIAAMSLKELNHEIEKSSRDLVGIRMNIIADQEKDVSKRKKTQKYIARLKTARRQKELGLTQST